MPSAANIFPNRLSLDTGDIRDTDVFLTSIRNQYNSVREKTVELTSGDATKFIYAILWIKICRTS